MSLIILIWICLYWCGREGIIIKTVPGESSNIVPVWCNTLLLGTRALLSVTLSIPGIIITLLMSKTILTTVTALPLSLIYFDCLEQDRSESERGSTRCNCVKLWQKKTLKCLQQKMPSQAESRSRFIGFAPSGTSTQTSPSSYTSQEYQVSWLIRSLVEIFDKNSKIFPPFEWNTKIQRPGLNPSPHRVKSAVSGCRWWNWKLEQWPSSDLTGNWHRSDGNNEKRKVMDPH